MERIGRGAGEGERNTRKDGRGQKMKEYRGRKGKEEKEERGGRRIEKKELRRSTKKGNIKRRVSSEEKEGKREDR